MRHTRIRRHDMVRRLRTVTLAAVVLALAPLPAAAQANDQASPQTSPVTAQVPAPRPDASSFRKHLERWVDLQTATVIGRFRRIENSADRVTASHIQDSVQLRGRLKIDSGGRVTLNAGVATGNGFTSGFNNTGIGTGAPFNTVYLKQLYVAVVPAKGVEGSYGGLPFVRGQSTEATSYDNDGSVVGARVSVKRPRAFYFDEISVTAAYLGDTAESSFFARARRVTDVNYGHVLVAKKLLPWLSASTDFTTVNDVKSMRAAVLVKTAGARVIDTVRYEQYRRGGSASAYGFSASAEKVVNGWFTAGAGYADVDPRYGGLNGDRFNKGRRWFETATIKLTRELSAQVWATQAAHNDHAIANAQRVDVLLTYNALATLQRAGLFKR